MINSLLSILLLINPYISKVYEYKPAPGQFTNALPAATAEDTPETMAQKAEAAIAGNAGGMICLGAWGGYVVFGFDHPVVNSLTGYDFAVYGNATYAANRQDLTRNGGSSEPGIVMVSYDSNRNGLPDDEWYELAGSEYNSEQTQKHYTLTYTRPESADSDVEWSDNSGNNGVVPRNPYHKQDYYPLWLPDEITYTGTLLAPNAVDESGKGSMYILYCYDYGYADNHSNTDDGSKFCIRWAVDEDGNSVSLPAIHFVKVYTGVQQVCGWLGETSTEITGAEDLHPDMPFVEETGIEDIISSNDNGTKKIFLNGHLYIIINNQIKYVL